MIKVEWNEIIMEKIMSMRIIDLKRSVETDGLEYVKWITNMMKDYVDSKDELEKLIEDLKEKWIRIKIDRREENKEGFINEKYTIKETIK